jgi:hypothetical protein
LNLGGVIWQTKVTLHFWLITEFASTKTGVANGGGTTYPTGEHEFTPCLSWGLCCSTFSLVFWGVFYISLFGLIPFCSLLCLSFFNLRLLFFDLRLLFFDLRLLFFDLRLLFFDLRLLFFDLRLLFFDLRLLVTTLIPFFEINDIWKSRWSP